MKHSICMISDFFYPNVGGVENHIYQLSQQLISRGHKVVVVTHYYGDRVGVRYLTNYLKVYYLPFPCVYLDGTFPLLICTLPLIRDILIREQISIVHGHGAYSGLTGEGMLHGALMGVAIVFTDHSLFGFADVNSILTNKLMEFFSANVDHAICVSYTSKENTILRMRLPSERISVIPNAIDGRSFTPNPEKKRKERITVMVVSRLVYRKGTDLLARVIPTICHRHDDVDFIIGGDGPKRILLEEVRERHSLEDRVTMLGMVPHSQVREVLAQGDIFINASITEAFCIAILEAACCGLQVVSTNVGGVPEVLPPEAIHLVEPSVTGLIEGLEETILSLRKGTAMPPDELHRKVRDIYTWSNVAERTELIYDRISVKKKPLKSDIIHRLRARAPVAGIVYVLAIVIVQLAHILLDWYRPPNLIDKVPSTRVVKKQTQTAEPRTESNLTL